MNDSRVHLTLSGNHQNEDTSWWADREAWSRTFDELAALGLTFDGWYGWKDTAAKGAGAARLRDRAALLDWVTSRTANGYRLTEEKGTFETGLGFQARSPFHHTSELKLVLMAPELTSRLDGLPGTLRGYLRSAIDAFVRNQVSIQICGMWAPIVEYRLPRPPLKFGVYSSRGYVVEIYNPQMFATPERRPYFDLLASAPLPPDAERWTHGDILVIEWVRSLGDLERAARAMTQRDRWLLEHGFPHKVESGYNAHGDYLDGPLRLTPLDPLTLYSFGMEWGFQAVVPSPDGSLDASALEPLREALAAGQLPSGHKLKGLSFIVPDRDAAVRLLPHAKRFGARTVLYPAQQPGMYWDIDPPGLWLDP